MMDLSPELRRALWQRLRELDAEARPDPSSGTGLETGAEAAARARAELLYAIVREIRDEVDAAGAAVAEGERDGLTRVASAALAHLQATASTSPDTRQSSVGRESASRQPR